MHNVVKTMLAVTFLGLASRAALSDVGSIREQIQAAVRQGEQSMARKDIKGYMSGYANDFLGRDIAGDVYSKQQAQQSLAKSLSISQSIQGKPTILTIQATPKGAVVLSREHTVLHIVGRRTHKMHVLIFDGLWRSVWVKSGPTWLLWRETQLSQTITADGKARVVKPSTRPA